MRKSFVQSIIRHLSRNRSVFLTADLGFMALEPLRDVLGTRFINAGVAEQNMISVAAGLAKTGLDPWVYSIAPFCYARAFEQIRNDVCLHRLPVRLVGNGGGYGYGAMGATHHALEDYGVLLTLGGMRAFIPAFDADVDAAVVRMSRLDVPSYLRLGLCELPSGFALPPYQPWRRLTSGGGPLIAAVGPLTGGLLRAALELEETRRPELWAISELPIDTASIPEPFQRRLRKSKTLWAVEEHVAQGGFGHMLAASVLELGCPVAEFRHFCAQGYPSHRYGSQQFHRKESGIDADSIIQQCLLRERRLPGGLNVS
jgi:transketolase